MEVTFDSQSLNDFCVFAEKAQKVLDYRMYRFFLEMLITGREEMITFC